MAAQTMKCLVYDKSSMPWDKTRGFQLAGLPTPVIDEARDLLCTVGLAVHNDAAVALLADHGADTAQDDGRV